MAVTDDDGDTGTDTIVVTVNNVAPTIVVAGAATTDEGSTYTLNLGAVTDPGTDTVTSYIVDWGDGSSDTYSTDGDQTHIYADGPNTWTISVALVDEDDTFGDAGGTSVDVLNVAPTIAVDLHDEDGTYLAVGTKSITVNNVAPTIALSGDATTNEGASYSLTLGTVTDPGTDAVDNFIVHWGDGSTSTSMGPMASRPTRTTTARRRRPLTVDLHDEDGTYLAAGTKSITVNNVAPTIASLTSNPSAAVIGQIIVITGVATDPSNADTSAGFTWHFDPGTGTFGAYGPGSLTKTVTSCGPLGHPGTSQGQERR